MHHQHRYTHVLGIALGCITLGLGMASCGGAPSKPYGDQPAIQQTFVKKVQEFQSMGDAAENDLQLAEVYRKSTKAICPSLPENGVAIEWQGKLIEIDANSDGKAVVEVEIAPSLKLSTWNNALSDFSDDTLIEDGPLRDGLLTMKEGQLVTFSGQIMPLGKECFRNMAILKRSQLVRPEFLFRFKSISPSE